MAEFLILVMAGVVAYLVGNFILAVVYRHNHGFWPAQNAPYDYEWRRKAWDRRGDTDASR